VPTRTATKSARAKEYDWNGLLNADALLGIGKTKRNMVSGLLIGQDFKEGVEKLSKKEGHFKAD